MSVITSFIRHNGIDRHVLLSHPTSLLSLLPPSLFLIPYCPSLFIPLHLSLPLPCPSYPSSSSPLVSPFPPSILPSFYHLSMSLSSSIPHIFVPVTPSPSLTLQSVSLSLPLSSTLSSLPLSDPPSLPLYSVRGRGEMLPSSPPSREGNIFASPACYCQMSDASGVISQDVT